MTNHPEDPAPTASDVRWGRFLAATLALYALVLIVIPAIRLIAGVI